MAGQTASGNCGVTDGSCLITCSHGGIGRHKAFKPPRYVRVGSSPSASTMTKKLPEGLRWDEESNELIHINSGKYVLKLRSLKKFKMSLPELINLINDIIGHIDWKQNGRLLETNEAVFQHVRKLRTRFK